MGAGAAREPPGEAETAADSFGRRRGATPQLEPGEGGYAGSISAPEQQSVRTDEGGRGKKSGAALRLQPREEKLFWLHTCSASLLPFI